MTSLSLPKIPGTLPLYAVYFLLVRLLSLPVLFIAVNSTNLAGLDPG